MYSSKGWRALQFVMRVVKKGNKNTKILATNHWNGRYWNVERHAGTVIGYAIIKALEGVQKRRLNLLTMKENLIGKLRLSAGGRLVYVHFTRHTVGRGRGKTYGIGFILQVT